MSKFVNSEHFRRHREPNPLFNDDVRFFTPSRVDYQEHAELKRLCIDELDLLDCDLSKKRRNGIKQNDKRVDG